MRAVSYFYNCSREYINSIDDLLYDQIITIISFLPKRNMQSEINNDLFWLLTAQGWSYDTLSNITDEAPPDIKTDYKKKDALVRSNNRNLCATATTLDTTWHSDFAKLFGNKLVQIEAQFGKVESMSKDFCGFKIGFSERRLALGIEIVVEQPNGYFAHRKKAIGGMAYFEIARKMLPAIALDCPIWVIGLTEGL